MAKTKVEKVIKVAQAVKDKTSSKEPQTMEDLLKSTGYSLRGFKRGDVVEGTVVSIKPSEILIDVGYKSLGVVSEREVASIKDFLPDLKVGAKITVAIVSPESEMGQLILSIRRAGLEKKWLEAQTAKQKGQAVEVTVTDQTKSGLLADWEGLRGFIPASQLEQNVISLIGTKLQVQIIEVEKTNNRLVFSQRRIGTPAKTAAKKEALAQVKIGQAYDGDVTGLVPFGLFVKIKVGTLTIEGLVHISEIAWEKVASPGDYFKVGDKVKVLVISKEEALGKLNLSIKQLSVDPWQERVKKYVPEQQVAGKVTKMTAFGAFVELEKGVEGLVHISKLPVGAELKEKEKVTCVIEGIDFQKRKVSLGLILKEKPMGYK